MEGGCRGGDGASAGAGTGAAVAAATPNSLEHAGRWSPCFVCENKNGVSLQMLKMLRSNWTSQVE